MIRRSLTIVAIVGLVMAVSIPVAAQTRTGRIMGQVDDPGGEPDG